MAPAWIRRTGESRPHCERGLGGKLNLALGEFALGQRR